MVVKEYTGFLYGNKKKFVVNKLTSDGRRKIKKSNIKKITIAKDKSGFYKFKAIVKK